LSRFEGDRLVVATHNPGKRAELEELLAPFGVTLASAAALGLEEPEETGATFALNARIKADAAMHASGLPALADDSGLEVRALGGRPGVHSARWAGPGRDFGQAMRRIHDELDAQPGGFAAADRRAAFVAALCLAFPDGRRIEVEGRCEGLVVWPARGAGGFGYDPIFQPEGERRTFAELEPQAKHAIGHRGRALRALVRACFLPEAPRGPG
jgi:XTP/dITP diphosphohydrolase